LAVGTLIAGVGGWAALAEISGAVIARGAVVVDTNVKTVQHPTGGIVAELSVREGDFVEAGGILIRLDATQTRATHAIASNVLDEMTARKARLESERDGTSKIEFPTELLARAQEPAVMARIESEQRAFDVRSRSSQGRKAQFRERISQLDKSIEGHEVRHNAKVKEIEFIARELTGARGLWRKGLMPISKLTALEREETRLEGERGQLISLMAEIKAKIFETELQILQVDHDTHNDIVRELREADSKISELRERVIAAEDQLRRVDIRAPHSGRVLQLSVHTVGAVIGAGDPILVIVPEHDTLGVEVRVNPADIDQLRVGQPARLRFLAFNHSTTRAICRNPQRFRQ
jgi:HlyD family secretion protein